MTLNTAILTTGQTSPLTNIFVWLKQTLQVPGTIILIKFLLSYSRPDIVVIKSGQGQIFPFLVKLLIETSYFIIVFDGSSQYLEVKMPCLIDGDIPFELSERGVGKGRDTETSVR